MSVVGGAAPPQADVLATIVAATRRTIEVRQELVDTRALEARATAWQPRGDRFAAALRVPASTAPPTAEGASRPNIIAECKRRSPSKGVLRADYDAVSIARAYAAAGAAAISVLTEPSFFDGALEHLAAVRAAVDTPLLRKDFTIDEYQLLEARAHGADAILLIVAALDDATLRRLLEAAMREGFAVLVEVHTREELDRAQQAGATIVGVNSRDLKTLSVSLDTTLAMAQHLVPGVTAVAESGIRSRADIDALVAGGYHACLIGERLVTEIDPGAALQRLLGVAPGLEPRGGSAA
jgi:indole-3-glycerol phosphate synthase